MPLDGAGIGTVIVFAGVSLLCIVPVSIPLPMRISFPVRRRIAAIQRWLGVRADGDELERVWLTLSHTTAPVIGVLILLASQCIGGSEMRGGIVGRDGVEPYNVLALFLCLAYIAMSLDATGLLQYLAGLICQRASMDGRILYVVLYAFLWLAGVVLGNDPVILSGTTFLVEVTRVAGIVPPSAWVWAQFVAANVASAVLVSSNPTNLVVASGFGLSFVEYTAYMVLPSLAAALAALVAMLVYFRGVHGLAESRAFSLKQSMAKANGYVLEDSGTCIYIPHAIKQPARDPRSLLTDAWGAVYCAVIMLDVLGTLIGTSVVKGVQVYQIGLPGAALCFARELVLDVRDYRRRTRALDARPVARLRQIAPRTTRTVSRLPLDLVPFAFSMFILVQGLAHVGFVSIMARGVVRVCRHSAAASVFFMGFLSMVLCNVRVFAHPVWWHQYRRHDPADQSHPGPGVCGGGKRRKTRTDDQGKHVCHRARL